MFLSLLLHPLDLAQYLIQNMCSILVEFKMRGKLIFRSITNTLLPRGSQCSVFLENYAKHQRAVKFNFQMLN